MDALSRFTSHIAHRPSGCVYRRESTQGKDTSLWIATWRACLDLGIAFALLAVGEWRAVRILPTHVQDYWINASLSFVRHSCF
jgi:hypothetical protein